MVAAMTQFWIRSTSSDPATARKDIDRVRHQLVSVAGIQVRGYSPKHLVVSVPLEMTQDQVADLAGSGFSVER